MWTFALRCVLAGLALAALTGCGDDEPIPPLTVPEDAATTEPAPETVTPPPIDKPSGPAESAATDPRRTELERAAERAVRRYVAALDARDGDGVCSLLVEGALDDLELPEPRANCAASLAASIGYRDPRGLPVWDGAELTALRFERLGGRAATAVATVQTRFADRAEISVEDDVIYLTRDGGRWLVAKPSSTLYRAVGIADVPPTVLAPPPE